MNEFTPNPDAELDALFARARAQRPDTSRAEYGFETRLLARLRSERNSSSIWAMVSWRLIPFLGAGVVALLVWNAQLSAETDDAVQTAYNENPEAVEIWSHLN
jgi:hypothetical protein